MGTGRGDAAGTGRGAAAEDGSRRRRGRGPRTARDAASDGASRRQVHAAVTEALAPGAEAHDAVNAFAAAEFRPGLAAGNYTKKLCGGRGSRPKAILLHTSDGAPPDAPETRAFWDLYRGPPCQYGHFVAFNLP